MVAHNKILDLEKAAEALSGGFGQHATPHLGVDTQEVLHAGTLAARGQHRANQGSRPGASDGEDDADDKLFLASVFLDLQYLLIHLNSLGALCWRQFAVAFPR